MRKLFIIITICTILGITVATYWWENAVWLAVLVLPVFSIGMWDMFQAKHSVLRNFPVVGHMRWFLESLRVPIRQYLMESELDGEPTPRMFRSLVYQRAKKENDTTPLGTKINVYRSGYEWLGHSLSALNHNEMPKDLRVTFGGPHCKKPYNASILNISAMSYGALSQNAILALNGGAKLGKFAHNTGEGGLSLFHLEPGGDLIWQIGTGYFSCRKPNGEFSPDEFKKRATLKNVKMIEVKLSQGAKPGHGGILPAAKNSAEISKIRGTKSGTTVFSPPTHSSFSTPVGLLKFVEQLRDLSEGKPVGFKLCIGRKSEFISICKAMLETGIKPDFITVDGGEGGSGAAPVEYSNSIGMPLRDALSFVVDCLTGYDLKKDIKVIASGKVLSGFHIVKNLSLGADACNVARGMMLALGCVQALLCNTNHCPVGVATQDPQLMKGLDVSDKRNRVANFHNETVKSVIEILAAAGYKEAQSLKRRDIFRRTSPMSIQTYNEIFPEIAAGAFLRNEVPEMYVTDVELATAESFTNF